MKTSYHVTHTKIMTFRIQLPWKNPLPSTLFQNYYFFQIIFRLGLENSLSLFQYLTLSKSICPIPSLNRVKLESVCIPHSIEVNLKTFQAFAVFYIFLRCVVGLQFIFVRSSHLCSIEKRRCETFLSRCRCVVFTEIQKFVRQNLR